MVENFLSFNSLILQYSKQICESLNCLYEVLLFSIEALNTFLISNCEKNANSSTHLTNCISLCHYFVLFLAILNTTR